MIDLSETPLPRLNDRRSASHKGDYGRALIVGGSLGMAGAPALAGRACLRSGAGLVGVATPACVQSTVAAFSPAYTTHGLADDGERLIAAAEEALAALIDAAGAIALGPGLGRSPAVTTLIASAVLSPKPIVIDADGLNALAGISTESVAFAGPRVLTPHAGEFARLTGKPLEDPNDDEERRHAAAALARSWGDSSVVVVLKGARTVITNGERFAVNTTGNPGMATGGSGDVLTGIITALLCQGLDEFDAARLGAHVHGLAGDLAAAKLGQISLIATDLIDHLPAAWQAINGSRSPKN